jgi:cbb3-type cytochrome oxidase subunit 1
MEPVMHKLSNLFLRGALIFFGTGVTLGVMMSVSQDFALRPVHVHVNLLGWVGFFIYAAFYRLMPSAAESRLAWAHFYTAAIGTPVMLLGLWLVVVMGTTAGLPLLLGGEALTVLSVALFITVGFRATASRNVPRVSALPAE